MLLRPARVDDYPAFVRLFPELAVDDPTPSAARWAAEFVPGAIVVEEDGAVLAYTWVQELGDTGYVRHVVVAPDARGRGLGRALMDAAAARFRAAGLACWCLNVKPENATARRLYEAVGMAPRHESVAVRADWGIRGRLPASDATTRVVVPAEDAAVEASAGLLAGQLADGRARGRIPVAAWSGADVVGAALFDPAFPGAFPFRARTPAVAGALLRALHGHRRPEHDSVQVVVEGDAALADALLAAGGSARMRILHYAGAL